MKKNYGKYHRMLNRAAIIIAGAILFTVTLTGCYVFPKEEEVLAPPIKVPEEITYDTIEATRGVIEDTIKCTGFFVSVSQRDLYYQDRGGRLKQIYVQPGSKVKKGDLLAELDTTAILNDVQLQEIALKRSQILYEDIKTRYEIDGGSRTELDMAKLEVDANQIRLDNLKAELARSKLVSPIDGEAVYVINTKIGEYVEAYQTIVRVADVNKLQLRYSQDKVNSFKLGMEAVVNIDGEDYKAVVVMTPGNVPEDADEETKKSVNLEVEDMPDGIPIGRSATISLTLESQENVIKVPKQVVNSFAGRKFVNVLVDGIREERDIEVGIETSTEVEVVKGLEEGELIIVR